GTATSAAAPAMRPVMRRRARAKRTGVRVQSACQLRRDGLRDGGFLTRAGNPSRLLRSTGTARLGNRPRDRVPQSASNSEPLRDSLGPLIERNLATLAILPPAIGRELGTRSGDDRELDSPCALAKDAGRAPRVEIARHQQHVLGPERG